MKKIWLLYASVTTVLWGLWGAFIEIPEKAGFPATMGYAVWALTMVPCALIALAIIKWKLEYDAKSVLLGSAVGFLGAGGQLILFEALRDGPAYVVFPVISLFPVVTIILSTIFLKETTNRRHKVGIALSLLAIVFLSYQQPNDKHVNGYWWLVLSIIVFLMWGIQAYVMKFANNTMKAESIFFYMTVTALLLIPVVVAMTDFSKNINWGFKGPWLAAIIQIANAIGALMLVYALRYGKAIIVVPMTALAPVITIIISLIIYSVVPHWIVLGGMLLAVIAIYLLAE